MIETSNRALFLQQVKALIWRNYLLKKENKGKTLSEFLVPVIFVLSLASLKFGILQNQTLSYPAEKDPTNVGNIPTGYVSDTYFPKTICFAPNSSSTIAVASSVVAYLNRMMLVGANSYNYTIYESVKDIDDAYIKNPSTSWAAVILNDDPEKNGSYSIRMPATSFPRTNQLFLASNLLCVGKNTTLWFQCPSLWYSSYGFSNLQAAVDSSLMTLWSNASQNVPSTPLQILPREAIKTSSQGWESVVPLYLVISFSPLLSILVTYIVLEKERKIKEGMLMMGMKVSAYWIAWFLTQFVVVLFVTVVTVGMIYAMNVFSHTSMIIFFILVMLFGLSVIMLAFMITPFFNNHKVAGTVSGFVIIFFSLFYLLAVFLKSRVSSIIYYLLALLSPTAYALALVKIADQEASSTGINGSNLFSGDFSVGSAIIMLSFDILLYGFLTFYFDNVVPGEFGPRRSPFFCFLASYWYRKDDSTVANSSPLSIPVEETSPDVERVSNEISSRNVIKIRDITKIYNKGSNKEVRAINEFSLNIYEGQITALLGHNGAGKTTLINMLVGVLEPTGGSAVIYGYDVRKGEDVSRLRHITGVCLQEDILFDDLNAKQHLEFVARLKGVPPKEIPQRISDLMNYLELADSATTKSKELSGGQKRKLCVGIALIGDPKLLILDEPSSGLDPHSRRKLWNLLERYKEDRVIILTTHFMDEADVLADRKAIISKGKLRCAGSSLFLKKKFGVGYYLTINVDSSSVCATITDAIQSYIPTAQLHRVMTSEYSYTLPTEDSPAFPKLFDALDEHVKSGNLGILSYGISMTTLEEVFLKLGDEELTDDSCSENEINVPENILGADNSSEANFLSSPAYKYSALRACLEYLKARLQLVVRSPKHIAPILIMPIFILMLSYALMNSNTHQLPSFEKKPLLMKPSLYDSPSVFKFENLTRESRQDFVTALEDQGLVAILLEGSPTLKDFNKTDYLASVLNNFDPPKGTISWTWLFNPVYQHSLPILQNVMANSLWAAVAKPGTWPERKLELTFDPFPLSETEALSGFDSNLYFFVLFFGMLFSYIPTIIATEVVDDRLTKVKNQLKVSGFGYWCYWSTTLILHSLLFLVDVVIILVILMFLNIEFINSSTTVLLVWLLFILFVPASLSYCYVLSHLFNKPETAKSFLPFLCYLPAMILTSAVSMLDIFQVTTLAKTLHYVFGFAFPFYVPSGMLYYLMKTYKKQEYMKYVNQPVDDSIYFEWENNIVVAYVMLIFHVIVFNVVLRIADTLKSGGKLKDAFSVGIAQLSTTASVVGSNKDPEDFDEDVIREQEDVKRWKEEDVHMPVLIDQLNKVYMTGSRCSRSRRSKIAVKNLSLAVQSGNIFGLLGPNGAGKTSTLRMMTAEETITSGTISIFGHDIRSNSSEAFQILGYCPQYDALWNQLTLAEHLSLYAVIKGVHPSDKQKVCKDIMDSLNITEHANKKVKQLSGGTKRKLSYAISILGKSEIVLLDEPSTGMDPQSKNLFWKTIIKCFPPTGLKSAVLTTHSMEEAETLCSRVGIMVNGSLRCLGAVQHLKDKYGQGYTLDLKLSDADNQDRVHAYIKELLPGVVKKETLIDKLSYTISRDKISSLGKIFAGLEKAKEELCIIDEYNFSQVTLEQVFLQIIREQNDD